MFGLGYFNVSEIFSTVILLGGNVAFAYSEGISNNSLQQVQQLEQGQNSLEGVKIGEPIQDILANYGTPLYSFSTDGKRHYYEFNKDNGVLVITADGEKNNGHIIGVSMSYNQFDGPSYDEVKNIVGDNANAKLEINPINGSFGYIQSGKVAYQFGFDFASDKELKLYRIDIR
ncbi:Uncharacterised protein [Staphylococcus xylosus]|uniref:SA0570 family protein n=1 Tax=Staphylococcus xylosus TaxID=1288 RepID=UPI00085BDF66|nr:hypothetical protein [Staphylococcus xylosus]SCU36826.1 Uncharacterised protein [Staphylococcus xylosus]